MKVEIQNGNGGKWIYILILALICGFLIYLTSTYKKKYDTEKARYDQLSYSVNRMNDSVKIYKKKWSDGFYRWNTETTALYLKNANIEDLYHDKVRELKQMGIKMKDINSASFMATETVDSVPAKVIYVDSLHQLQSEYRDEYIHILASINRDYTSSIKYSVRDSIIVADLYKRHRFLFFKWKSRQNKIIATSKNPKTKIVGLQVLKVIE